MEHTQTALITGCIGGIGQELIRVFKNNGYLVIGLDLPKTPPAEAAAPDFYISCDLNQLCEDNNYRNTLFSRIEFFAAGRLNVLINNAAYQSVKATRDITLTEWNNTLNVNLTAPFLISQRMLPLLESNHGSVINISSIHAKLTKPEFVAYATSKAALAGMTKAMAVDLGGKVRVNAVCPAAISTPMLVAGFQGHEERYKALSDMHPSGRIGRPEEVAYCCLMLADTRISFLTGACIGLDGGIASRLHDPV